jgi:SAM-dependent methyltransferase
LNDAMPDIIDRSEGRRLFGLDPDHYCDARPDYPAAIYRLLVEHGAIRPGSATLEIGAGPGLATRRLLELGADPLTVVEPDARFEASLEALAAEASARMQIVTAAFEEAALPTAAFDLVAAATSYHWLDPNVALAKIAAVLRPGGHVALWWNIFGDLDRPDPFHDATRELLADTAISPSGAPDAIPFGLDRAAREAEFARSGEFAEVVYAESKWTLTLDTARVGKLYEGFSHIQRMPALARERLLVQLMEIADAEFGGRVERNVISPIYLARRR